MNDHVTNVDGKSRELSCDEDDILPVDGIHEYHERSRNAHIPKEHGDDDPLFPLGGNELDDEASEKYGLRGKAEYDPGIGQYGNKRFEPGSLHGLERVDLSDVVVHPAVALEVRFHHDINGKPYRKELYAGEAEKYAHEGPYFVRERSAKQELF